MSLSGHLRTGLGNAKKHLKDRIARASALLAKDYGSSDDAEDLLDELMEVQQLLEASMTTIKDKDKQWTDLLRDYTDKALMEAEQPLYDKAAIQPTDGYLAYVVEAEDRVSQISTKVRKLNRYIARQATTVPPTHPANSSTDDPLGQNHTAGKYLTIKPPKIVLPTFTGDVMKWKEFWSLFKSNIHDRPDLTGVEKLSYLLPQLQGVARQTIEGLLITDDNYEIAIDILTQRFERSDDRLVPMLYGQFKQLPRSTTRKEDKRRTLNECDKLFRQMRITGENIDNSRVLTMDFLSKFPAPMVRDLQRHYKVGPSSTLSEARAAIDKSIAECELTDSILHDLDVISGTKDEKKRDEAWNQPKYNQQFSKRTYYNQEKQFQNSSLGAMAKGNYHSAGEPEKRRPPCYLCSGDHFNADCTRYRTANARLQRLTALRRCTRCAKLNRNHLERRCTFDVRCWVCGTDDHCTAVCPQGFPEPAKQNFRDDRRAPNTAGNARKPPQQHACAAAIDQSARADRPNDGDITLLNDTTNQSQAHMTLFQTALVDVQNPVTGKTTMVRMSLDTFSNRSYVTDVLANELQLQSDVHDNLCVSVFGSQKTVQVPTRLVDINIKQRDGSMRQIQVNTTKMICNSTIMPKVWPQEEKNQLDSLRRAGSLADDPNDYRGVSILVGADFAWDFIVGAKIPTNTKISLIPTTVGMMLAGRLDVRDKDHTRDTTMLCITESTCVYPHEIGLVACETMHETKNPDIDEYWSLESMGIKDCPIEDDDEVALQKFNDTVKYVDGRYHVAWPWIEDKRCILESNRDIALRRFQSLSKRLRSDSEVLQVYRDVIKLQTERGIIEKVPLEQAHTNHTTHYLPHHPVFKPTSATTKVRIVYDASAKKTKNDVSLNECLYRGPVMLPDLCQLLMKFRVHRIAVVSDLEKAFLQLTLQPDQRDVTRFFWFEDDSTSETAGNIALYRFARVLFGVTSSPFLLAATLQYHLKSENTEFAKQLADEIYVDNIISGLEDDKAILDYYQQSKDIFSRAGMNLYQFCSNSKSFMEAIPAKDRVKETTVRVLGMIWRSQDDDTIGLTKSTKWQATSGQITKRKILQNIASIFDPLGLFQPVLFPAKLFLQKLWIHDFAWDDPVSDTDLLNEFHQLKTSMSAIFNHRIPRHIGSISVDSSNLVVFSDASAKGYGAAVYFRSKDDSGVWLTNLLMSKSRLAPIAKSKNRSRNQQVTLPRLELLGASIAVQLANFCRKGLKHPLHAYFFIDSECVLKWLRSDNLKQFVARRIDTMRKMDNCEFRYVHTDDNPADLLTRGRTGDALLTDEQWWHGPKWLSNPASQWPESSIKTISDAELREVWARSKKAGLTLSLALATNAQSKQQMFLGIDPKKFSSLRRLVRVTCLCLTFLKRKVWNKLHVSRQHSSLKMIFDPITTEKIDADTFEHVKQLWTKTVQHAMYPEVFNAIQHNKQHNLVQQLGLKLDEKGILRSHSRFENADLCDAAKRPMLLPKNDHFSALVVQDVHQRLRHSGVSHTLSESRRQFWIPHGRLFVRNQIKKCLICRKIKTGKTFALPNMPDWPKERVARSVPFQYVGIDYFGPVKVKIGDAMPKMWVSLFSCLATRAIHLEAVTNFASDEFLRSLMRFVSRRGCPQQIISDNAGQFHLVRILGQRAWRTVPTDDSVLSYSAQNGIRWKHIIELAPWQGGHYERLVGVVKGVLKAAIGRRTLSWSDFITLLTETEAIVNSRPITYVSDDIDSQSRVLRPMDFLVMQPNALQSTADFKVRDLGESGKGLAALWKLRKRQLDKIWQHWYEDYLTSLRERAQSKHRNSRGSQSRCPREGEVVLLREPDLPRGSWKLARVVRLISSADHNVRAAEIELANKIRLRRTINFLIPLEVDQSIEDSDNETDDGDTQQAIPAAQPTDTAIDASTATENQDLFAALTDDDDEFFGFSPADIQRTVRAMQLFDDLPDDE